MTMGRRLLRGEALLGAGLVLLAAVIAADAAASPPARAGVVGPALFPFLFAGGLLVTGLALLRRALAAAAPPALAPLALRPAGMILAGLAAQGLLLQVLGWILASAVLFACVAAAFGSRRHLRDGAAGLALGAATFAAFSWGLGLDLPAGAAAGFLAGGG